MVIVNGHQRVNMGPYADHVVLWFHYHVLGLSHRHVAEGRPLSNQGFT